MIYRINRKENENNRSSMFIEFAITESGKIYLFTEEDLDPVLNHMNEMVLTEGKLGGYPPIKIKYSGSSYGVELVPEEDFKAAHNANRIKLHKGGEELGTRHISFSDDDPICKRGAISIYRNAKGEKYIDKDKSVKKSNCLLAARSFVYCMIDDIEDFYDKKISYAEMQDLADKKFSSLTKSQQEKYANDGEKLEKGKL